MILARAVKPDARPSVFHQNPVLCWRLVKAITHWPAQVLDLLLWQRRQQIDSDRAMQRVAITPTSTLVIASPAAPPTESA